MGCQIQNGILSSTKHDWDIHFFKLIIFISYLTLESTGKFLKFFICQARKKDILFRGPSKIKMKVFIYVNVWKYKIDF